MTSIKSFIFISIIALFCIEHAFAARFSIVAPQDALANRQPITVLITLDPEKDRLSGISGKFSFKEDLFEVQSISVENSAVPLWITQPNIEKEKSFDGNTSISFEGIFPGGFDGVRSPYYSGTKPGLVFSVTLVPKNRGRGVFMIHSIDARKYDSEASKISVPSVISSITVPELLPLEKKAEGVFLKRVESQTLNATITQSDLISSNAWYITFNEREPKSAIQEVYVAETSTYDGEQVDEKRFRKAKNPEVLTYQSRSVYVHLKIVYSDNTYTIISFPPVENSTKARDISRILISIIVGISILYFYAHRNKKHSKDV